MKVYHSVLLFLMILVLAVGWLGTSPVGAQGKSPDKPITTKIVAAIDRWEGTI